MTYIAKNKNKLIQIETLEQFIKRGGEIKIVNNRSRKIKHTADFVNTLNEIAALKIAA